MTEDTGAKARGPMTAPDEVWAKVREDYLSGLSAQDCCRRHGVGLTSLRDRAARDGWRRQDRLWMPRNTLDPWDEGAELELKVEGNLDKVGFRDLAFIAYQRTKRAVLRGDAVAAMRWWRVERMMDEADEECARSLEEDEAMFWHVRDNQLASEPDRRPAGADSPDSPDSPDCVFESGPDL